MNEYFDVDDVAGARRRFEEVARELEASPAVDNRCVRVVDRAFARHRRGEDVTDVFGAVGDPAPGATVEHLATRGDTLELARWRVGAGGEAVSGLVVFEIDDADRVIVADAFAADELEGATASLDARHGAVEPDRRDGGTDR